MTTIYGTQLNDTLSGTEFADISIFGYEGDDLIYGLGGNDIIDAGLDQDIVYGGDGDDTILGRAGNDALHGENDNDVLFGEAGEDWLHGGRGNDYLLGGDGADLLTGVQWDQWNAGKGEIDSLTGGEGSDRFVLGDSYEVYYDDAWLFGLGQTDYALIKDFDPSQDSITLHGSSADYVIGGSGIQDVSGLGIYHKQSNSFELIGVLQNVSFTSVDLNNPNQFVYT
jgi:Ca2+-binding RTX toxin-like protein